MSPSPKIAHEPIPLTHGQTAQIDDDDYARVSEHAWHAYRQTRGRRSRPDGPIEPGPAMPNLEIAADAPNPAAERAGWYAATTIGGKNVSMHAFILGDRPGLEIDHINNDGLCNTRANLRHCTHRQNCHNSLGKVRNRKSRFKGVCWNSAPSHAARPWRAIICVSGKQVALGHFATEEAAALSYNLAASWAWGRYANLNRW